LVYKFRIAHQFVLVRLAKGERKKFLGKRSKIKAKSREVIAVLITSLRHVNHFSIQMTRTSPNMIVGDVYKLPSYVERFLITGVDKGNQP